jgi:hypothetical protein
MDEIQAEEQVKMAEYNDFKENVQVKAVIAGQLAKHSSVKLGDIEIRIKSAVKKGLRDRILALAKKAQAGEVEAIDLEFYDVISEMCIETPWTRPEVWRHIDEETGMIPKVFEMIIEKVVGGEKSAQTFRRDR